MISLIAAVSENNIIGNKGSIPWHLPKDFKHFKETTTGHPVIMGRKTYESIGKPLPNRENVVLSKQNITIEEVRVFDSVEKILEEYKNKNIFVIGGSKIYASFLPYADKIVLTRVHAKVEGDTYFPNIDKSWVIASSKYVTKDENNAFDMTFEIYEKTK